MSSVDKDKNEQYLYNAIRKEDKDALSSLVAKGYCLNLVTDGTTPLVEAAHNGNIEIIEFLLSAGADINLVSQNVVTPICAAAAANKLHVVEYLVQQGCEFMLQNGKLKDKVVTPLQFTILNDNTHMAALFLRLGHDPNYASLNCGVPLVEAIKYNRPSIVKLLLDLPNCKLEISRDIFGRLNPPPLHQALFTYRRYEIAEILLKSKRVNLQFDGHSFLSWLLGRIFDTSYFHKKMARILLEAGADMVYLDRNGNRPLVTVVYGNQRIFNIKQARPILELLITAGIPVSAEEVQPLYEYVTSEDDMNFCRWLTAVSLRPRLLKEQCRTCIRKHLGNFPNDKIQQLGLPPLLERYVTLEIYRNL